ncbi:MAG: hypothetical protein E3J72_15350 [Planctomycetota bacterium]|nr:MAG: hypothetical protein E3J72_15350 [Planctomycetota bacterium]
MRGEEILENFDKYYQLKVGRSFCDRCQDKKQQIISNPIVMQTVKAAILPDPEDKVPATEPVYFIPIICTNCGKVTLFDPGVLGMHS